MPSLRSFLVLFLLVLGVIAGCEDAAPYLAPNAPRPTSITLSPPALTLAVGTTGEVRALVTFSDQSTKDVTGYATWTSSDSAVASVSGGRVTALKAGFATITASGEGQTRTVFVTVSATTLVSINLTPSAPIVPKGLTKQLVAMGTFSDNTTQDLSTQVAWSSAAPGVASISPAGLVTTVTPGPATISATFQAVTGTTLFTVSNADLVSLEVTPASPTVPKGFTKQMTATGTFTDASTQDITAQVTWASTSAAAASVNAAGLARALTVGPATISATLKGISGKTVLTVSNAELVSIAVTPTAQSVPKGLTQQFTAIGTFTDMSTQDLTTQVTWSSSDTNNILLNDGAPFKGRASTPGVGTATVIATFATTTGNTTLTVTAARLLSMNVSPVNGSRAKGLTAQMTATGLFTDGSTADVTTMATWSSSDTNKVTLSNAAGSQGLASTPGLGAATVTAKVTTSAGLVSAGTTLNVTAAVVASIAVSPQNASRPKGTTEPFSAIATFTDGTEQYVTATAAWSSTNPNLVTIDNTGLATAVELGTVTIHAAIGAIVGSATFTVSPRLVSICVTPVSTCALPGDTVQFVAMGTFEQGPDVDITPSVTWTSSDMTRATIAPGGLATTSLEGQTQIRASLGTVMSNRALINVDDQIGYGTCSQFNFGDNIVLVGEQCFRHEPNPEPVPEPVPAPGPM